jgi:hypothetical protein
MLPFPPCCSSLIRKIGGVCGDDDDAATSTATSSEVGSPVASHTGVRLIARIGGALDADAGDA